MSLLFAIAAAAAFSLPRCAMHLSWCSINPSTLQQLQRTLQPACLLDFNDIMMQDLMISFKMMGFVFLGALTHFIGIGPKGRIDPATYKHYPRLAAASLPGENATAVTGMAAGAASLLVSFVVGLHSVLFGALGALPLLFSTVLSAVVFSDAHKVAQRMAGVVMQTRLLRTYVYALALLLHFATRISSSCCSTTPLQQRPRYL
jgi:hypothetical protein